MQSELRRILEESRVTTFFVTHDQEEAMTLSDTIVVMEGQVSSSRPARRTERSTNVRPIVFVAGFLGKTNFIEEERRERMPFARRR